MMDGKLKKHFTVVKGGFPNGKTYTKTLANNEQVSFDKVNVIFLGETIK